MKIEEAIKILEDTSFNSNGKLEETLIFTIGVLKNVNVKILGNHIQDYSHKSNEVIIDTEGGYCGKVELTELSASIVKAILGEK